MNLAEIHGRARRLILDEVGRFLPFDQPASAHAALVPVTPWRASAGIQELANLDPDTAREIVHLADEAMAGRLPLLGLSSRSVGNPVRWNVDPITGREAPHRWFTRVPYLDSGVVGDHKGTWELNRLQWLVWPIQAWQLTGEQRYAVFTRQTILHWIESNPPRFGINWASALEVSLRAISLTTILHLAANAPDFDPATVRRIIASIEAHARFVQSHLSTWFAPNTHLTGEALGLLVVGTAWPQLKSAARWQEEAWNILSFEGTRQLREDGSYFEQSSWYLSYTVDFFIEARRWGRLSGRIFSARATQRLERAASVLAAHQRPDGSLVAIGDDDAGSLWSFAPRVPNPSRQALLRAARELAMPELAPTDLTLGELASLGWLEKEDVYAPSAARRVGLSLAAFPNGGIARIADETVDAFTSDVLIFDAGPHGTYGHSHDDPLTFDLSIDGVAIVVDPGTGSYVKADVRGGLRGASAHATLQSPLLDRAVPSGAFSWDRRVDATLSGTGCLSMAAWAEGRVFAERSRTLHQRVIIRVQGRAWILLDLLESVDPSPLEIQLHVPLAAGVSGRVLPEGVAFDQHDGEVARLLTDSALEVELREATVSPAYGVVIPSNTIRLTQGQRPARAWCNVFIRRGTRATLRRESDSRWIFDDDQGTLAVAATPTGTPERGASWSVSLLPVNPSYRNGSVIAASPGSTEAALMRG